tara:strand:+ start:320 stop:562 length:243 start_codon:yes stop_codon:yes gene_type:complete
MELVDLVVDMLLLQVLMLVVVSVDSHLLQVLHLVDKHLVMDAPTLAVAEVEVETIQMAVPMHLDIWVVLVLFSSHIPADK